MQEISDNTKIGIRLLKALEDDQFDQLPGGIFDKSFVRQYARHIGLNEEQVLTDYREATGDLNQPSSGELNSSHDERGPISITGTARRSPLAVSPIPLGTLEASPQKFGRFLTLIIAAALLAGAAAAAYYAFRKHPQVASPASNSLPGTDNGNTLPAATLPLSAPPGVPDPGSTALPYQPPGSSGLNAAPLTLDTAPLASQPPPAKTASPGTPAPAKPPEANRATPGALAKPTTPAVTAPATDRLSADAAATNPGEGLVLEVSARRDCWVSISSDGQKQWQGMLLADRSRRVQAKDSFELTIGDAGAVTLALNGKPLAPVGKPGEVRRSEERRVGKECRL